MLSIQKSAGCKIIQSDFTYDYSNFSGLSLSNSSTNQLLTHLSNGNLHTFDPANGEFRYKQSIPLQGPRSVGGINSFSGAVALSKDSFLYSSNIENKIVLVLPDTTFPIVDYSDKNEFRLMNYYQNRPLVNSRNVLFGVYPGGKEFVGERMTYVSIDKKLNQSKEVISAANIYTSNYQYGATPYLYWPSVVYNETKSTYMVSFPVDHNLYEYSNDFELIATHEVFHHEIGEISVYDKPLNEAGEPHWEDDDEYYAKTSYFVQLHYLPDAEQYVRIGKKVDPVTLDRKYIAFVYDASFKMHTSFELPPNTFPPGSFASGSQFHVLNEESTIEAKNGHSIYDCYTFSTVERGK